MTVKMENPLRCLGIPTRRVVRNVTGYEVEVTAVPNYTKPSYVSNRARCRCCCYRFLVKRYE